MYDVPFLKNPGTTTAGTNTAAGSFTSSQLVGVYAASNYAPGTQALTTDQGLMVTDGVTWKQAGFNSQYLTRQSANLGALHGAAATLKFLTYSKMVLFNVNTFIDTLGTSTFSSTLSANTVQLTVIVNTNTTGTAVTLTTTTFGPYAVGGPVLSTTTGTAVLGGFNQNALSGTAGFVVPQGSECVITGGTDATSTVIVAVDYQLST